MAYAAKRCFYDVWLGLAWLGLAWVSRCEARQLAYTGDKKAQALRENLAQFLYLLQLVITSMGLLNGILTALLHKSTLRKR